jgi:hypothetical protein
LRRIQQALGVIRSEAAIIQDISTDMHLNLEQSAQEIDEAVEKIAHDYYTWAAVGRFLVAPDAVSYEQRECIRHALFGILYGATASDIRKLFPIGMTRAAREELDACREEDSCEH